MEFKTCINHATMMKTDLDDFFSAVANVGFEGVELRRDETFKYLETHSIEELGALISRNNLKVVTWNAIELFSLCSADDFKDMCIYTERLMKIGNKIGCDTIIAVPSFTDRGCVFPKEKFDEKTVERLQELRSLAYKYNFRMGFEPLGFPTCSVRKVKHALQILKDAESDGKPKSGLIIDTFHYFLGGHEIKDLDKIPIERLWLIHINDSIKKPLDKLQDGDRVWPGSGFFDLKDFLIKLKEKGYTGYVSLELFNEEYWKLEPHILAQKAYNSLKSL